MLAELLKSDIKTLESSRYGISSLRVSFCIIALACISSTNLLANDGEELFENHIRPLLIEKCGECHSASQKSGSLSMESRESLIRGGDSGNAISLDQPLQSLLLKAVRHSDELAMPPDNPLNERQIAVLETWLKLKAPWPESGGEILSPTTERARNHWAFQPISKPEVPATAKHPVDAFVLDRLQDAGLSQPPRSDKPMLIRRLYYTLTGLPPTYEQIQEFVSDEDPQAYEHLVDKLLDSPQYGEHWARHWLDVARYSDTKGYVYAREERFWVHAWTYRDWVVRALNEDMPYDHFLRLQIAADQVPDKRNSDLAAMGFLTLGRRFLGVPWEIIDDRIDTLARATMGLTLGCARCHDHKYDPIPTADYYSLYGVFASSKEQLVRLDDSEQPDFDSELQKRKQALNERLTAARNEASDRARSRIRDYLHAQTELDKYPAQGFDQVFSKDDLLPAFVRRWQYFLHRAEVEQDRVFIAWRKYRAIPQEEFATQALSVTQQLTSMPDDQINPLVRDIFPDSPQSFDDVIDRYAGLFTKLNEKWQAPAEQQINEATDPDEEELRAVLYGPSAPNQVPELPVVHTETFFDSGVTTELWKLQGEVDRWIVNSPHNVPFSVVLRDRQVPHEPRIFRRGDPVNYGDDVPRRYLSHLSDHDSQQFANGSGRQELAEEIVSPDNPLTARVIVNRVWMHHFGQGLVTSPSDFGLRAAAPSHPKLLDWLASEFMQHGWSLKSLHRLILTSNTFQMQSSNDESQQHAEQIDPQNRLLWKMNSHRLTFEEFRDSLLATSGNLDRHLGGKPANIFAAPYPKRRTLYGLIDRQYLPSTLRIFDFANPDLHIPKRSETTVPQQSLFLMNHPIVLEIAKDLAKQAQQNGKAHEIVAALFRQTLQRKPSEQEVQEALQFVALVKPAEQPENSPTAPDWQYGFGGYDESAQRVQNWQPLPHFTGEAWQGGPKWPDAKLGWTQLTATGGHPGNDRVHACVRRWTAPRDLSLTINSTLVNEPAQGDGIRAFIVSSEQGLLQHVKNHQQPSELNIVAIQVKQGETIDFVVDIDEQLNSDQFLWDITIHETDGTSSWNSKNDFPAKSVPQLNGWEQLAHALLCTNEFMFVD